MPSLTIADTAARTTTVAEPKKKKNWIKGAVKPENRGKFKAKAEAAGETTREFAAEHKGDSGKLGQEARFAENVMGLHKKKKRTEVMYGGKD